MEQKNLSPVGKKTQEVRTISQNSIFLAWATALFVVLFLWWFWSDGIYAFGFNITALWVLIFWLYFQNTKDLKEEIVRNLYWIVPLSGIILSFSLYENPFLKTINIFLLPLITLFFYSYARLSITGDTTWKLWFLREVLARKFSIWEWRKSIIQSIEYGKWNIAIIQKITIWVVLLFAINIIIISLLATADSNFAEIIGNFVKIFSFTSIIKLLFWVFLLFLFTALKLSWDDTLKINNPENEKRIDSIIAGIVIWGTLITYLTFIGVQINTIMTHPLSQSTGSVISLAKNGFWQLFFVSIINILFFFVYYKKTNESVQNILSAFVIASLIILISAWHKMFTYVYHYGLSYEKFFASYTVIYFGLLFCVMLYFVLNKKALDILKISLMMALYMYSFINIFPTEKYIFNMNTNISQRTGSHIQPYQSHMLSIDILDSVKKRQWSPLYISQGWEYWVEKRLRKSEAKNWYEKNLSDF